tara:strand:+ start:117 stop:680 length:564 start_codon:yes stop_codon:yes gene_type:complete
MSDLLIARPISWSGGSTFMYKTNSMITSYYYHYSPNYKYSIGGEYVDDKYFDNKYFNIRGTYLLDRNNAKSSQRNLYITAALSTKESDNHYYGIHGDWETRRVFTSFSQIYKHTKTKDYSESELQFGVAPYLGEYNELHSWAMIKAKKETINNNWDIYPYVKIFKGDFLLEIGTKNSHWDIHYMLRF